MKNNNISSKIIKILMVLTVIFTIMGGSLSYWNWISGTNKEIVFNTSKGLEEYIIYDSGESKFIGDFGLGSSYLDGVHTTVSIYKTEEALNVSLYASINMRINEIGEKMRTLPGLKWAVTAGDSTNVGALLASGNFLNLNNQEEMLLLPHIEVTEELSKYTIWIWLDENEATSYEMSGETVDTSIWTQVDQIVEDIFEITRLNNNYQIINATVVNSTNDIVSYAITTENVKPVFNDLEKVTVSPLVNKSESSLTKIADTTKWIDIPETEQNKIYNFEYMVNTTGTYYLWFKDTKGKIISDSITISEINNDGPVCSFSEFSKPVISSGETTTIDLICVDNKSAISDSTLEKTDFVLSNNYAILSEEVVKEKVDYGYKYTLTLTGTDISGNLTITLNANAITNIHNKGNDNANSGILEVANTYTISYKDVGDTEFSGVHAEGYPVEYNYGETTKLDTPTKTGYTFLGYYLSSDGSGSAITSISSTQKGNLNLYAKWEASSLTFNNQTFTKTYSLSSQTITLTGASNGTGSYSYSITDGNTGSYFSISGTTITMKEKTPKNTYSLTVKATDTKSGAVKNATITVTVNAKNISDVTITLSPSSYTYDGTAKTPTATVKDGDTTLTKTTDYTVSYSNNTNASTTAKVTITGTGNYTGTASKTFTIAAATVTVPTAANYCNTVTYNGANQNLTKTAPTGAKFAGNTGINATEYTITATLTSTTNYKWSDNTTGSQTFKCSISKKAATITAKDQSISYGGSIATGVGQITHTTLISGHSVSAITLTPSTSNATTNGIITPKDAKIIDGSSNDVTSNYNITYATGKLTIGKINNTLTVSAKTGLTYNGSAQVLVEVSKAQGDVYYSVGTELTSSNYSTAGSKTVPTGKNATTYKVYFYTPGNNNYNTKSGNVSVTIASKSISGVTITLSPSSYTYDGTAKTPTATVKDGDTTLTLTTDYTVSYSNNTNAGTTAKVTITGTGNYTGTASKTFTINAATVTVPTAANYCNTVTYNGASQTLTKTAPTGAKFTNNTGINATEYTITASLTNTTNYKWSDGTTSNKTFKCSIGAKAATITAKDQSISYGGSIATGVGQITSTGFVSGHTVTAITLSPSTTNATNDGKITPSAATVKDGSGNTVTSNYNISYVAGKLVIGKIDNTLTVTAKTGLTYNGSAQALVTASNPQGDVYYSIGTELTSSNYSTAGSKTVPTGKNATTYKVYFYTPGNNNYNPKTGNVSVTIAPKSISGVTITLSPSSYTYDGTAKTPTATVKDGDTTLTLTTDYTVSYSNNTNAGTTAKVTITGTGNYTGTASKTFTITAATVTVPTAANYCNTVTYNGASQTLTKNAPTGAKFAGNTGINATEYTITATLTSTTNYKWSDKTTGSQTFKCSISKKAATITAKDQSISYGGSIATGVGQITSTGFVSGHTVTAITLSPSTTNATNDGKITPSAATVKDGSGNTVTSNYNISYVAGKLVIGKIDNTLTVTAKTGLTYNGSAQALVTASNPQGDVYYSIGTELTSSNYSTAGSKTVPTGKNATTYKVYFYTPGNTNYNPKAGSVSTTIAQVTLTPNVTVSNKAYDGTVSASATVSFTGAVNSEVPTGSVTCTFNNKNVGTSKPVSCTGITLNSSFTTNYKLSTTTASKTANITQKAITITAKAQTITYGNSIANNTSQVTVATLVSGDGLSAITLTPSTTSATTTGTITPKDAKIVDTSGVDMTGNYSITYATGKLTINKASCSCTINTPPTLSYPSSSTGTLTYNCTGDGTVTVSSGSTNVIAIGAYNATSAPLVANNTGTSAITVSQAAGTNYSACTKSQDITVSASTYIVTADSINGTIATTSGWTIASGSKTATKTVTYNSTYGTLPSVSKTGYTFNGWQLVPNEYQQVEYIQSSGTQYIDTGYYWKNENVEIYFDGTVITNGSGKAMFGNEEYTASSGNARNFSGIPYGGSGSYSIYLGNGSQGSITGIETGTRFNLGIKTTSDKRIYVYQNGVLKINKTYSGTMKAKDNAYLSGTGSTTVGNIFLFANHNSARGSSNGPTQNMTGMRAYAFKLYDNNVLVRDLIPCYRKSDNVVGMYDRVNGVFYTTPTGSFTAGDAIYLSSSSKVETSGNHTIYANYTANALTFSNQTFTKTYSLSSQTIAITGASNGTGSYSYSITGGNTGSYFSISGTTITMKEKTPKNTYTLTVKATDSNSGATKSATIKVTVNAKSISGATITLSPTSYTYDGTAKKPTATVKDGSTTLTLTTDYTVSYSNNTNAGTATVTITGAGNYTGTATKTFTITAATVTVPTAANYCNTVTYNGASQTLTKTAPTGAKFTNNTGINATEYTITASLTNTTNYKWNDGTTSNKTFKCSIGKKAVTITAKAQTISYGGSIATDVGQITSTDFVSGHTVTAITLTPSTSNVTTTGTITPSAAIVKDGSSNTVTSNYNITYVNGKLTINKATSTCTISAVPSLTYPSKTTGNVTFSCTGDGAITVTSGNTNLVTVGAINSAKTSAPLTAKASGQTTVTVSQAAGTNYAASSDSETITIGLASYKLVPVSNKYNIAKNGDFGSYQIETKSLSWDSTLNGVPNDSSKVYNMSNWGYGLNSGVAVPEIGYHAHMRIIDGNAVLRFKTNEAYAGKTGADVPGGTIKEGTISWNRWLGVNEALTATDLTVGKTYAITMDIYRVSGANVVTGGLYYKSTSSSSNGFHSGKYSFKATKTGEWETFSWTFTLGSDYSQSTSAPKLYIYGYDAAQGEVYVDNVKMEEVTTYTKDYGASYTSTELTTPTRTGYTFGGWYNNASFTTKLSTSNSFTTSTATFSSLATAGSNAYIYGKWTANNYTITLNPQSGTIPATTGWTASGSNMTKSYTYGNTLGTLPTPTRTGYTFNGWYTATSGGTKVTSSTAVPSSNTTYYAQWTANKYTLTYDCSTNGGSGDTTASVAYGSSADLTKTCTKSGWELVGWNTDKDATSKLSSYTMPSSASTLYAIYKKSVTVKFNKNGCVTADQTGTIILYNNQTSGTVKVPSATMNSGWSSLGASASASSKSSGTAMGSNMTVSSIGGTTTEVARYYNCSKAKITRTATYSKGANVSAIGKTTDSCEIAAVYNGATQSGSCTVTLPTITANTGYTSVGWSTTNGATTGTAAGQSYTLSGNVTLYANAKANIYKITLNNQGATSAGTTEAYYQYNTTKTINGVTCYYYTTSSLTTCLSGGYNITKPTKNGYTFKGYYSGTNVNTTQYITASGGFTNNIYKTIGDHTLYAIWVDDIPPTVSYTAYHAEDSSSYTSGNWTKPLVYTDISAVDAGSGVSYIQYILQSTYDANSNATWSTFNFGVSSLAQVGSTSTWKGTEQWGNSNTRDQKYYFRACDVAGNCTAAANFAKWHIRYDKTAPTVSYTSIYADGTGNYTSGYWTNKDVYTTITGTDAHVGVIDRIQYTANANATTEGTDYTTQWKTLNLGISGGVKSNGDGSYYGTESWSKYNDRNNTFYFRVCDSLDNCSAASSAFTIKYDTGAPTCSITTTSTLKSTSQTATLTCTDNTGITSYYWGTKSNPSASDYTAVSSTKNLSSTKSVASAGTYYLFCKDQAGNVSASTSKTYYSYTVNNLLEKVDGTTGTYTSANYTSSGSATYIAPSGTSITLASVYAIPTGASSSTFKGYSTGYSTSAASPSTSAPSLSATTTYYMWFNRTTYTLTLNKGTGISAVSGAGTYKYGATASIKATVSTGYTFSGWTKNSGNAPANSSSASTTVTITSATTLTASASDSSKPIAKIETTSTLKSASQTATLTCSDSQGISSYYWGTKSSPSASDYTSGTPSTKTVSSAGTYYLFCKDAAGNVNAAGTTLATGKITYLSYTVQNRVLTVTGTRDEYNTTNYELASTHNYLISDGTTISRSGSSTMPSYGSAYIGHSIHSSVSDIPSTGSATFTTGSVPINSTNKVLVAWIDRARVNLSLHPTGGDISSSTSWGYTITDGIAVRDIRYGSTVNSLPSPTLTGYTFNGWYTTPSGGTKFSTTTVHTADTIYYAQWSDTTPPTGSVTANINDGTISAVVSASDVGSGLATENTYGWLLTTSSTCNASTGSFVTNEYSNYTFEVLTAAGTYYVCVKVTDKEGNIGYIKSSAVPYVLDTTYTASSSNTYVVPATGSYQLEVWGAQGGGTKGGYGGYSTGIVYLTAGTTLYLEVGGAGSGQTAGYNGGGEGGDAGYYTYQQYYHTLNSWGKAGYGGGGATHIATVAGELSTLSSNTDKILIVAGGGGGSGYSDGGGGSGGGYQGVTSNGSGGTQDTGNAFGLGGDGVDGAKPGSAYTNSGGGGGGGGYYGGAGGARSQSKGGGGGSGYIGNTNLVSKYMYCYNCSTSETYDQKTYSTTNVSDTPIANYAKSGDGAIKITFISSEEIGFSMSVGESLLYDTADSKTFIVPTSGTYKLEAWGGQGGGTKGGYGGYSVGNVTLTANTKLYISVGGAGSGQSGGYNGGGTGGANGKWTYQLYSYTLYDYGKTGYGGGGASHIATTNGLLSTLSSNVNNILIVAGGGGGSGYSDGGGGSAGGYQGVTSNGAGATQTTGNAFGVGGNGGNGKDGNTYVANGGGGGGGGYYGGLGGSANQSTGGGGGSGYIGNSLLTSKAMYCYNCSTSTTASTLTNTTTNVSSTPTANYAKSGNGAIRITLMSES